MMALRLTSPPLTESSHEQILREPYNYICQTKGKEIRVKLIEALNVWLQVPHDKKEQVQVITQMLHNASLILDDIEDNSNLRRGIPSAHNVYTLAHTINSANYICFMAMGKSVALGQSKGAEIFTNHLLEAHRGQGKDIYWRDELICPTEEEYLLMVKQKTGSLFELAVDLMQLFSENKEDFSVLVDLMGQFFQIRDDYANLSSKEYADKKSFCEDLTEGKFSFPIIHGIQSDPDSMTLINILKQKTEDIEIKKYFLQCLEKVGSLEYTRKRLIEIEARTLKEIQILGGNPHIEAIIQKLSLVYKMPTDATSIYK